MCQTIYVNDVPCETIGELRLLLPQIVKCECYAELGPDSSCLCGVDPELTALANGMICTRNIDRDHGDYRLYTKSQEVMT